MSNWGDAFIRERAGLAEWKHWSTPTPRVCFLHGALHIFPARKATLKVIANGDDLFDTIDFHLGKGRMPLIVCEGTANRKRAKIFGNDYLRDCYLKLEKLNGKLFIYGCSLAENDLHIWEAVDKNPQITNVFIGFFGAPEEATVRSSAAKYFSKKNASNQLYIFDSSAVQIWS